MLTYMFADEPIYARVASYVCKYTCLSKSCLMFCRELYMCTCFCRCLQRRIHIHMLNYMFPDEPIYMHMLLYMFVGKPTYPHVVLHVCRDADRYTCCHTGLQRMFCRYLRPTSFMLSYMFAETPTDTHVAAQACRECFVGICDQRRWFRRSLVCMSDLLKVATTNALACQA